MGTSSPFPGVGKGKPVVPSWAGHGTGHGDGGNNGNPPDRLNPPENPDVPPEQQPDIEPIIPYTDFKQTRINLGKYPKNNRDNQYLRRGLASYVRNGLGGSRNAAVRMSTTRKAATTLYSVVQDFVRLGRDEAIEHFNLTHLQDRGLQNVFTMLADFICTPGSGLDEAITRQAYLKTVEQFPTLGIDDQGEMTVDVAQEIMFTFITESIFSRIVVDVGESIRKYAEVNEIVRIEQDIHDYIKGCVQQRIRESLSSMNALEQRDIERHVQEIYENAFEILVGEGDE